MLESLVKIEFDSLFVDYMDMKTYRRQIILSSVPIRGHFRHNDYFQLLPPDETMPQVRFANGHHPIIIEYCFDTPEERVREVEGSKLKTPIPHWLTINEVAAEKLKEILQILSVLTNARFFVYG